MTLTPEVDQRAWALAIQSLMWKGKGKNTRAEAYSKNRIRHLLHATTSKTENALRDYSPQPTHGEDFVKNRRMLNIMKQKDNEFLSALCDHIHSINLQDQKDFFRALLWNVQILETISNASTATAGSPIERFKKILVCEEPSEPEKLIEDYQAFYDAKP